MGRSRARVREIDACLRRYYKTEGPEKVAEIVGEKLQYIKNRAHKLSLTLDDPYKGRKRKTKAEIEIEKLNGKIDDQRQQIADLKNKILQRDNSIKVLRQSIIEETVEKRKYRKQLNRFLIEIVDHISVPGNIINNQSDLYDEMCRYLSDHKIRKIEV